MPATVSELRKVECDNSDTDDTILKTSSSTIVKTYTSSCASSCALPNPFLKAFIFDWDDTCLCSTYLSTRGYRLNTFGPFDEIFTNDLILLDDILCRLFEKGLQNGSVWIVTNSETGWVELTARRFLPSVARYLGRVVVISARSSYEYLFPGSPFDWKYTAFKEQITSNGYSQIMGFGDQIVDRNALRKALSTCPFSGSTLKKTVKFADRPTLYQLYIQLLFVYQSWDQWENIERDMDLIMTIDLFF